MIFFFSMRLKTLSLLIFALIIIMGGQSAAFEVTDNIVQQDKDLFSVLFQGGQIERKPQWHAGQRALCSSSFRRNKAGRKVYIESIRLLNTDGTRLTTIRRQIFPGQQNAQFLYNKTEEQAVLPFVFASTLRYIVDRADERIDFHIWKMDTGNMHLLGIETKCYKLDTMQQVGGSWDPVSK